MAERAPLAGIVLAAGNASRFRGGRADAPSKAVAMLDGKPLVRRVVEAGRDAGLDPIVVVTGFRAADVAQALAGLDVRLVHNSAYEEGLARSLAAGLASLPASAPGAVILLADMPRVGPALIARMAQAFADHPDAAAVSPTRAGEPAHPVVLGRALFADAAELRGDAGARRLFAARGDVLEVDVEDEGATLDIDTPQALDDLRGRSQAAPATGPSDS